MFMNKATASDVGMPATFEIILNNNNPPFPPLRTVIKSINDLPAIPATFTRDTYNIIKEKEKKSGKIVVKAEEIQETVNNITVREIEDPAGGTALVVQWPEPDVALFGGLDMVAPNDQYQIKVRVGAQKTSGMNMSEVFLWYDVPAQMGTVVVDADTYDTLKQKFDDNGFDLSDLRVTVWYREFYTITGTIPPVYIPYINSSLSFPVPINTF
jgi:hypothetical protein